MAIGGQITLLQANEDIQNMAVQMRNLMQYIRTKVEFYQNIGAAGLEAAPVSMASADATAFMNKISEFAAVSGVYYGTQFNGTTANNGVQFNFDNDFSPLTGGI